MGPNSALFILVCWTTRARYFPRTMGKLEEQGNVGHHFMMRMGYRGAHRRRPRPHQRPPQRARPDTRARRAPAQSRDEFQNGIGGRREAYRQEGLILEESIRRWANAAHWADD